MKSWLLLFLLLLADVAPTEDKCAPVATITEASGRIETNKDGVWQKILPLQPLCNGAEIRVGKKGRAVLTYLGFSTIVLTSVNSPYTVHEPMIQQSRSQKAMIKLREIFLGLMSRTREQTASLMTRGNAANKEKGVIQPVSPRCERMLFPMRNIVFQWKGGAPPYLLRVSERNSDQAGKRIFEAKVLGNSAAIPAEILRENTSYQWVVDSGTATNGGEFQVLSMEDSLVVRSELMDLQGSVLVESEATRILIEYGFFIEKGFFCDAQQIKIAGEKRFPQNDVLKSLAFGNDGE